MMNKYKGKFRIPTARLKSWDYGANALYFVTICTANKSCYFGTIAEGEVLLSDLGRLANAYWLEIENKFSITILDHVVMPNHIHGMINIDKKLIIDNRKDVIKHEHKVLKVGGVTGDNNPMLHENLSRFIHWYKGRCTFEMRKIHPTFAWQPRFHEHIIRDEASYLKIAEYIQNNPLKWEEDKYFNKGV
ncbi:MAG: transposase [Methylovulum sp.]|nr:transposase [Methylovulum sp.]